MSFYRTDDAIADFDRYDAEQQKVSEEFPTCCECGCTIYEDFIYEYNDEPICDDCMSINHRKSIEYFM